MILFDSYYNNIDIGKKICNNRVRVTKEFGIRDL